MCFVYRGESHAQLNRHLPVDEISTKRSRFVTAEVVCDFCKNSKRLFNAHHSCYGIASFVDSDVGKLHVLHSNVREPERIVYGILYIVRAL